MEKHFGADVYLAHPYCAWQRATNENTNGLLRQFLPKKTDFRSLTQAQLDIIAHRLNSRPRKRLNYRTTCETFEKIIVFPNSDPEIADQFLTQTYSLSNGCVTYSKGNDHIVDATRCMVLSRDKVTAESPYCDTDYSVRPPLPLMCEPFGEPYQVGWWPREKARFLVVD